MTIKEEKKIEIEFIKKITNAGGFIKKVAPKENTGNKGYPDLTGVLNRNYLGIEVKKSKGGKPTPVQLKTLQKIANAGGIAIVTNDINIIEVLNHRICNPNKLTTSNPKINIQYTTNISDEITIEEAYALWNTIPHIHTLQILPSTK